MDVFEFYGPFAHVPGRIEWCRIRSPTHGVFDTCVVLGPSTADPADVYVDSDAGAAFMADRFPASRAYRVRPGRLRIAGRAAGRHVSGALEAEEGPVRQAAMEFRGVAHAMPDVVPYGGDGRPVWGGPWTCEGVDLNLPASVHGHVRWADGSQRFAGEDAIVTLGSYGRLRPL